MDNSPGSLPLFFRLTPLMNDDSAALEPKGLPYFATLDFDDLKSALAT